MPDDADTLDLKLRYRSNLKDSLDEDFGMIRERSKRVPKIPLEYKKGEGAKAVEAFHKRLENLKARGGIHIPVHFQAHGIKAIRVAMTEFRKGVGIYETQSRRNPSTEIFPKGVPKSNLDLDDMVRRMDAGAEASRKAIQKAVREQGAKSAAGAQAGMGEQGPVTIPVVLDLVKARAELAEFRKEIGKTVKVAAAMTGGGIVDERGQVVSGGGRGAGGGGGGGREDQFDKRLKQMRQLADTNAISSQHRRSLVKADVELARQGEHLNQVNRDRVQLLQELRQEALRMMTSMEKAGKFNKADKAETAYNNLTRQLGREMKEHEKHQQRVRELSTRRANQELEAEQELIEKGLKDQEKARETAAKRRIEQERQRLRDLLAEEKRAGQARRQAVHHEASEIRSTASGRALAGAPFIGGPTEGDRNAVRALRARSERDLRAEAERFASIANQARAVGDHGTARTATVASKRALDDLANSHIRLGEAVNRSGHALNMHSRSMLRNAVTAASWLIPIQAMYAGVQALRAGLRGLIETDREFATFQAVFSGGEGQARLAKDDLLSQGVAQGSQNAMDAGIRFGRLQQNRVQIIRSTRDALVAQNVAEISAAEGAEFLSSVLQSYKLTLGDLPGLLNRVNELSNTWNVTNKDLIQGLQRVSGIAQQSGFSLQNLEGVLAASIGASGRPGSEIGNALKFIITRIRRPEVQAELQSAFDVNLSDETTGALKGFDEILRELAQLYPTLTRNQQAYFLDLAAGSRQASRLALILENYTQAQILTTRASANANSAYLENEKILASLEKRLESTGAAWRKLFSTIGDKGGKSVGSSIANTFTDAIALADHLLNKLGDSKPDGLRLASPELQMLAEGTLQRRALQAELKKGLAGNLLPIIANHRLTPDNLQGLAKDRFFLRKIKERGLEEEFQFELAAKGLDQAQLSTGGLVREVKILEQELHGLKTAKESFEDLAEAASRPGAEISNIAKQAKALMEAMAHLAIPGMGGLRQSSLNALGPKATGEGVIGFLREASAFAGDAFGGRRNRLMSMRGENASKIEAIIRPLQQEAMALERIVSQQTGVVDQMHQRGNFEGVHIEGQKLRQQMESLKEVRSELQGLEEDLRGVRSAGQEMVVEDDALISSLEKRMEQVRTFRESLGQSAVLGNGVGPETGDMVMARAEAQLRVERQLLDVLEAQAQADVDAQKRAAIFTGPSGAFDPAMFRKRSAAVAGAFDLERNRFDSVVRDPRLAQARVGAINADLREALEVGRLQAQRLAAGSSVGLSSSRQAVSRVSALLGGLQGDFSGDPLQAQQRRGEISERVAIIQRDLNTLRERELAIGAELANLDLRRAEAVREQTEQRARALALASREDQVLAAVAARDAQRRSKEGLPGLSVEEFSFLPQAQKQAIVQFQPNLLGSGARNLLDPNAQEFRAERRGLDEELAVISRNLGGLVERFAQFDPTTLFDGAESILARVATEQLGAAAPVEQAAPQFDVRLGDIDVNLNEAFTEAVRGMVDQLRTEVQAELGAIRQGLQAPDPVAVAQAMGA